MQHWHSRYCSDNPTCLKRGPPCAILSPTTCVTRYSRAVTGAARGNIDALCQHASKFGSQGNRRSSRLAMLEATVQHSVLLTRLGRKQQTLAHQQNSPGRQLNEVRTALAMPHAAASFGQQAALSNSLRLKHPVLGPCSGSTSN